MVSRRRPFWQGRKASNPGPTVLETVALPAELHPYINLFSVSRPIPRLSSNVSASEESPAQRIPKEKRSGKGRIWSFQLQPEARWSEFPLT